jgi:RimJ/RimL family protein N-acetyltransferase
MTVLETERLRLRQFVTEDGPFILELLNQPSFLRFIGDKGVRTLDDAERYILTGPVESYQRNGFGLYLVVLREAGMPIGMCGLLRRDWLDAPDIGFSYLPAFWSRGYAFEAASAVMHHARETLGLTRILAIVSPDNAGSIRLLEKLGLRHAGMIRPPGEAADLHLFS